MPTAPLPPIDAELLYPTLAMEDDPASSIPAIEIPDPEIPSSPETPRELIGLQNTEEDILIFALGKDLVQQVAGEFIFQVSAFSEIKPLKSTEKNSLPSGDLRSKHPCTLPTATWREYFFGQGTNPVGKQRKRIHRFP